MYLFQQIEMGQISSEWQVHFMPSRIFAALQARFPTDGQFITTYWWFLVEGLAERGARGSDFTFKSELVHFIFNYSDILTARIKYSDATLIVNQEI